MTTKRAKGGKPATSKSTDSREPDPQEEQLTEATDHGAPVEHYHGERPKPGDDPGSLEEETLDPNAPYNKTYGK